jgi:hypothetical protein
MRTVIVLAGLALAAAASAQSASEAGAAVYQLTVREASFGTGRIGERVAGIDLWSREYAYDRFGFRVAAHYAYTRYEYQGVASRDRDLHHLHLPLQWRDDDDRWRLVLTPLVATSSNVMKDLLNRGQREDFDLYARWELQRPSDAGLGWRIGFVRDAAFGAPRVYPTAALLWRSERTQAELGLPASRVDWKARDDATLGLAIFPTGGQWHVVSDERGGAQFDYRARAWRAAFDASWSPWRRIGLGLQAGIEFARHYEFEDDLGAVIDRDAGSAPYWRLVVSVAF